MSEREKYPSEAAQRFQIRLPDGMRDRLREAAEMSNRSMNAEIVARLEESFSGRTLRLDRENERLSTRLERIERSMHRMMEMVTKEVARQKLVRADPDRRSPERYAYQEGYEAFEKNPGGPYQNPYETNDLGWLAYQNGFRMAAQRHYRDKARDIYPELWPGYGQERFK